MTLSERAIRKILEFYNIGQFLKLVKKLDSGFQSDNYQIQTSYGNYVVRILHDSVENVEYSMRIYEYLVDHMIKTPRPARTKDGTFGVSYDGSVIVVQTFIPGVDIYTPLERVDPLLPFYGRELGRVHQVTLQMYEEIGEEELGGRRDTISYVLEANKKYMPDNEYIQHQYKDWEQEIELLPKEHLTKAIIHGDVGPKDFFFKDGEYTGIIDFNAASLDFLLFDLAPMMMYCDLIQPEREKQYLSFMTNYLETSPIQKDELNCLDIILRTRWFVQIFYHQYRYVEGITQGLDTDASEENLEGVVDGENRLKVMDTYSKNHFYKLIGE